MRVNRHKVRPLEVYPYDPVHLKDVELREEEEDRQAVLGDDWGLMYARGEGYSFFDGDKFIFAGGIIPIWDGVGEAWMIADKCVTQYVRECYFYIYQYMMAIIEGYQYWRVHCYVQCDWPTAQHFMERLGYHQEAKLEQFGPEGKDYYIYTRLFTWESLEQS